MDHETYFCEKKSVFYPLSCHFLIEFCVKKRGIDDKEIAEGRIQTWKLKVAYLAPRTTIGVLYDVIF